MERCPVCRARISESRCGRCQSDLSELVLIEEQAELLVHQAVQALAAGDIEKAYRLCKHSIHLNNTPLGEALSGFLLSLNKGGGGDCRKRECHGKR